LLPSQSRPDEMRDDARNPRAAGSGQRHPSGSQNPESKPGQVQPGEASRRDTQLAGLSVLLSLATSVTMAGSLPGAAGAGLLSPEPAVAGLPAPSEAAPDAQTFAGGGLAGRLRNDHLVRNSLYIILSTGIQAGLGFAFWIVAARLFSAVDVGRASSLISATSLVSFLALLGLNSTFIRFLPTEANKNVLITAGVALVAACAAAIGLVFILLTPVIAPKLAFVAHNPLLVVGFALLGAAATVNLLTDSIFIAARRAGYNAVIDGGVGALTKLILCVALVGTGAYGLFSASVGGLAAAALASLLLMMKVLGWRPSLQSARHALGPLLRFSGANYLGNVCNMLPTLIVPLIVLDRIGVEAAAYYFVAFQTATLLYSGAGAVEQAFLAEGAYSGAVGRRLRWRSLSLVMLLCVPAGLVLAVAAHWIMLAFGTKYSLHATTALVVLATAAVPMGAINWLVTMLRLASKLRAIVLSNLVYVAAISAMAWFLAPRGLTAVCAAWPIGALLASVTAGVAVVTTVPRPEQARHRRHPRERRA
jgi:O-antigen/teichoic acid export membrane protein